MRVLLDTNIIISTALFPNSITAKAYFKAVSAPYSGLICTWSMDELQTVFKRKFPDRIDALNNFLVIASDAFEIIPTPVEKIIDETMIRDVNDQPILRAALIADVDYLLTGDKDFLESKVKRPTIISPADFLKI